jgi:hypothetical protein
VWVDHVGSGDTRFLQCALAEGRAGSPPEPAWLKVGPANPPEPRVGGTG